MRAPLLSLVLLARAVAADCPPQGLTPQETLAKFQQVDRQAQAAMDAGQFAAAVKQYREAACLAPKSARAWYGLGVAEAAAGNLPAAREAMEKATELLPDNALPLAMLVRVNAGLGDVDRVKAALRRAARKFPRDADLHAGLARFLAENKLLDLALAESLRAEQSGRSDAEAAVALAALENTVGAYPDALRHASAVEAQAGVPDQVKASAAGVAGLSYESLGQRDEAIRHLQRAIELAPRQENSYVSLAYLYEKAQRFKEAVAVLEQGRKQVPESPNLLLPLGSNLVWAEQYEAGARVLRELVQKSPDLAEAYVRLAEAYRNMGQPEREARAFEELARRKPDYPGIRVLLAQAMLETTPVDYATVLRELDLAEKTSPNDPDVFYLRGKAYIAAGRYQEALTPLRRAIELRPMEPGPYYQLGLTYRKLGNAALAREQFERMQHLRREAGEP